MEEKGIKINDGIKEKGKIVVHSEGKSFCIDESDLEIDKDRRVVIEKWGIK